MKNLTLLLLVLLTVSFAEKGMKVYLKGSTPIDVPLASIDSITFYDISTDLTEKIVKLYNPYAAEGFNSALNIVTGDAVAGEVNTISGKMVYAAVDSAVADLAVDNNLDIRATNVVAELTSINGGRFVKITKAEYDAATTDVAVKTLAEGKTFIENEVILTDQDDITVDGFFVMQLANDRGYAVVQMKELNTTDTEGSLGNTGYLQIGYRYTAK